MISLSVLQTVVFIMIAVTGTLVVLNRQPLNQAIGLAYYGLLLALMFFLLQAPDVAFSQLVVGAVALPVMVLLTLARMRREEFRHREGK